MGRAAAWISDVTYGFKSLVDVPSRFARRIGACTAPSIVRQAEQGASQERHCGGSGRRDAEDRDGSSMCPAHHVQPSPESQAMPNDDPLDHWHDTFSGAMSAARKRDNHAPLAMIPVHESTDILPAYRGTPIADLLAAHNLGATLSMREDAELLIVTCMDHRIILDIPECFAFVLRVAGANADPVGFSVSFAVSVAGVKAIAVIGHDDCAMQHVYSRRDAFVSGLQQRCQWSPDRAEAHFDDGAKPFAIADSAEATWVQAERLRELYAGVHVAPLSFRVDDAMLLQVVAGDAITLDPPQT